MANRDDTNLNGLASSIATYRVFPLIQVDFQQSFNCDTFTTANSNSRVREPSYVNTSPQVFYRHLTVRSKVSFSSFAFYVRRSYPSPLHNFRTKSNAVRNLEDLRNIALPFKLYRVRDKEVKLNDRRGVCFLRDFEMHRGTRLGSRFTSESTLLLRINSHRLDQVVSSR